MSVDRYTANYSFPLPDFNAPTWHVEYELAWDLLDSALASISPGAVTAVWANSTVYAVGTRVVDTADAKIYQVLVAHTSGASPQTFAQYRAANPTHWGQFNLPVARGAWAQNTAYAKNDFVYQISEHVYAICTVAHTSTAVGTIRTDAANWAFVADLKTDYDAVAAAAAAAAASAITAASVVSFRNALRMNGGMEVWQRGQPIAHAASTQIYGPDRWYLKTEANEASVSNRVAGLVTNSRFAAQFRRNAGQTGIAAMRVGYPLDTDEIIALLGKKVALSFQVRCGADWSPTNGTLAYKVYAGTGSVQKRLITGFTGETEVISGTVNLTTSVAAVSAVSAAVVPTNATQMEVQFQWTPVGTAGAADDFTIDDIQLEAGDASSAAASAFERRLFAEELALCQTHYAKSFLYAVAPAQNAGNSGSQGGTQIVGAGNTQYLDTVRYPSQMRIVPTIVIYNPGAANAEVRNISTAADWTSSSPVTSAEKGFIMSGGSPAGSALGNRWGYHWSADASIV